MHLTPGRHEHKGDRGFTLVEVLLVLAVLGLVLALAVPRLGPAAESWRVRNAAQQFAADVRLAQQMAQQEWTRSRVLVNADFYELQVGTGQQSPASCPTIKTYKLAIERSSNSNPNAPSPSNASLKLLSVDHGTLMPEFSPLTTDYTLEVSQSTQSVLVEAEAVHPAAEVAIGGHTEAGRASLDVPLGNPGTSTTITIAVTSADGSTVTEHVLTVNRGMQAGSNALLRSLSVDAGTLNPDFRPSVTLYNVQVSNSTGQVAVTAGLADPNASVVINGAAAASGVAHQVALNGPGELTNVAVTITSEDGNVTATYVISVHRAGTSTSNADLVLLTLDTGTLSPMFSPAVTDYSVVVGQGTTEVSITAFTSDGQATMTINQQRHSSGVPKRIPLQVGVNIVAISVAAADKFSGYETIKRVNNTAVTLTNENWPNSCLVFERTGILSGSAPVVSFVTHPGGWTPVQVYQAMLVDSERTTRKPTGASPAPAVPWPNSISKPIVVVQLAEAQKINRVCPGLVRSNTTSPWPGVRLWVSDGTPAPSATEGWTEIPWDGDINPPASDAWRYCREYRVSKHVSTPVRSLKFEFSRTPSAAQVVVDEIELLAAVTFSSHSGTSSRKVTISPITGSVTLTNN